MSEDAPPEFGSLPDVGKQEWLMPAPLASTGPGGNMAPSSGALNGEAWEFVFPPASQQAQPASQALLAEFNAVNQLDSLNLLIPTSSAPATETAASTSAIARTLEDRTARMINLVTEHNFDHPEWQRWQTDDYCAYLEYSDTPLAKSRDEFLSNYKAFVQRYPSYSLEILTISANVNEKNGMGAVWCHLRVKGHPANVERESVTIVHWKRRQGKWTAYRQNGVRGVAWYP